MAGVVLRCPNCGTVQPSGGECEACREAPVRYFCTNHDPGVWLDSSACPRCGARFGDPAPAREAPPPPERPTRPRPEVIEPTEVLGSDDRDLGPWGGADPLGSPGRGGGRTPSPDLASLLAAMLGAAADARSRRGGPPGYEEAPPVRRRRGGGCLGRLLMLALLLFALFLVAPFLLGALLNFG
ncbi:MAG TPA: hypothetical protein VFR28_08350 [Allosphingosinicella sp.]|jgi:hypothetical protein|nr:hypothetical protein [Allosphingosinicella sp.]